MNPASVEARWMKPLPFPDRFYLQAAEGWLSLGQPEEAIFELKRVSRKWVTHPDFLHLTCRVHIACRNWRAALLVSERQIMLAPERPQGWINHAFCLHELRQTREAQRTLSQAARRFPGHDVIAFNLACYCCHLRDYPAALQWINRTLALATDERRMEAA